MTKELVNPNLHVVLVHFPLALFLGGLAIEVCSFMYRRSSVRTAGRWMILLGALASIPTALSGAYALADVARRSLPPAESPDQPWQGVIRATNLYDGKSGPGDKEGDQWRLIERHIWVQGPATALAALTVVFALGCSDRWRRRLYLPLMVLLLAAGAMMVWGAWAGGEMVYRFGTGVRLPAPADPPPSATPARATPPPSSVSASPRPASAAAPSAASAIPPDGSAIPAAAVLAAATQPASVASTQPATQPVTPPPATAPAIPTTIPPLIPPLPDVPATTTRPAVIIPTTLPTSPAVSGGPTTQPIERPATTVDAGTTQAASPATVPSATSAREIAARSPVAASASSAAGKRPPPKPVAFYVQPLEIHVILAGCAIAVGAAAIGLSFRAAGVGDRVKAEAEADVLREQSDDPGRRRATPDDVAMLRSFKPAAAMYVDVPERVPAGRWWLLALLAVLLASLAGWWFLAVTSEAFDRAKSEHRSVFVVLWEQVRSNPPADVPRLAATAEGPRPSWLTRRLAHVAGAGSIVVLAIVLAALARWGRRARFMRWLCTLLLLSVVAAQVWVGLLLLFDTPAGSIYRFHRPPPASPQPATPSGQTIAVADVE